MSAKGVFVGLLAGAAAGAALGVLFAPDKGTKTRRMLKNRTAEMADAAKETMDAVVEQVAATSEKLQEEVTNLAKKSRGTLEAHQS